MCMIGSGDYGDSIWLGSKDPIAQKEHRCGNCRRTISPGERYHTGTWVYNGHIESQKLCDHCHTAAEGWLKKVCHGYIWGGGEYGYGLIHDDLLEHFDEHGRPIRSLDLGRLLVAMRRQWTRRDGERWPVEAVQMWAEAGAQRALAVPA